jgi:hypothetical protein
MMALIQRSDAMRRLRKYLIVVVAVVAALRLAAGDCIAVAEPSSVPDPDRIEVKQQSDIVPAIVQCLSENKEAVLFERHIQCTPYRNGNKFLDDNSPTIPLGVSLNTDCPPISPDPSGAESSASKPFNARRLSTQTINTLLKEQSKIGSHGIRLL